MLLNPAVEKQSGIDRKCVFSSSSIIRIRGRKRGNRE